MRLSITAKITLWVLGMAIPIPLVAIVGSQVVDRHVQAQTARDLENLVELEASRIAESLATVERSAESLAGSGELATLLDSSNPDAASAEELLGRLSRSSGLMGSMFSAMTVRNRDASIVAGIDGTHEGELRGLSLDAMERRRSVFGPVRQSGPGGEGTLLLAVPITASDGAMVGSMSFQARLAPLADPVLRHEGIGDTSEAILVQAGPDGTVQLLTLRRFDRDSAFEILPVSAAALPSALSLGAGPGQTLRGDDYRGTDTVSAVRSIDIVGWGLTIKMDVGEASAISSTIKNAALVGGAIASLALFLGWVLFLRPLGRRIGETSRSAETVSAGRYDAPIGDPSPDEIGELSRSIDRLASDLADDIKAREAVEARLRFQADHDDLTGLLSRSALLRWLNDRHLRREPYSVVFIDLDNFKEINDSMGHPAGDEALQVVASRLRAAIASDSKLARWGGDEFLIAYPTDRPGLPAEVEAAIEDALATPISLGSTSHPIRGSVGLAHSEDGASVDEIIRRSDERMFEQKEPGRRRRSIPQHTRSLVESALEDGRVRAHFQPFVQLDDDDAVHLVGAEALVRIIDDQGTLVSPAAFLPHVAPTALGAKIDECVMNQAIDALHRWRTSGLLPAADFYLSVNIGEALLSDGDRLRTLLTAAKARIRPGTLFIEIPETAAHVDAELVTAMHDAGMLVAIDDVGRQFSNLERMHDLSADIAKIDRRWVSGLTREGDRTEVTRTLIEQCRVFGLDVLAEGVETETELDVLRWLGVEKFQGYYFGRPVDESSFVADHLHSPANA